MDKLVAANSWPLLRYDTGNIDEATGASVIDLTIENAGVGPAIVKSFQVSYAGKPVASPEGLLSACCGYVEKRPVDPTVAGPVTAFVADTVIRAGERRTYLRLANTPELAATWWKLNQARMGLTFDACYCSVFEDCWRSDLTGIDAQPVDSCPIDRR